MHEWINKLQRSLQEEKLINIFVCFKLSFPDVLPSFRLASVRIYIINLTTDDPFQQGPETIIWHLTFLDRVCATEPDFLTQISGKKRLGEKNGSYETQFEICEISKDDIKTKVQQSWSHLSVVLVCEL